LAPIASSRSSPPLSLSRRVGSNSGVIDCIAAKSAGGALAGIAVPGVGGGNTASGARGEGWAGYSMGVGGTG
jgi:hypothetical protein